MLLEVIDSFISGFFHRLGLKQGNAPNQIKPKDPRRISDQPGIDSDVTDQEVWNIVTSYGKYKEVWPIYRHNGLLDAIKARDEKAEFDQKMSEINPKHISPTQQNPPAKIVQNTIPPTVVQEVQKNLDELDLSLVRGLASYFKEMNGKIRHYHQDHHASREEADVIANYYLKTADIIKGVKTQQDLKELLKFLETLKKKISRYQHNEDKYRWSTCLEKEVLAKLRKLIDAL
jgi:hypothetical protein